MTGDGIVRPRKPKPGLRDEARPPAPPRSEVSREVTRVFGLDSRKPNAATAPVHAVSPTVRSMAWCGVKSQYRHWTRPGTVEDVTCTKCQAAIRQDQPRSWKS